MTGVQTCALPISLAEALVKLDHLRANGASEAAFGWAWLAEAKLWQERACSQTAAE